MPIKIRRSEDGCFLISDPYVAANCIMKSVGGELAGSIVDPDNPKKKLIRVKGDENKIRDAVEAWFECRSVGPLTEYALKLKDIRYLIFERK